MMIAFDAEASRHHRLGQQCFHLVIGSLHRIAGFLRRADVRAEVNPGAAVFDEVRPAFGVDFDAALAELMPTGSDEQYFTDRLCLVQSPHEL